MVAKDLPSIEVVRVTALGGQGDGVARLQSGEVVLIAGGVPGDEVAIQPLGKLRGVQRGRITELSQPSPHRTVPTCAIAHVCGGCTWQHVDLGLQRSEKEGMARRTLGRQGCELTRAQGAPALGHRRRVRLHLRQQNGRLCIGMMLRESDAVAATEHCPALEPALDALLPRLRDALEGVITQGEIYAVLGAEGALVSLHAQPLSGGKRIDAEGLAAAAGLAGAAIQIGRWQEAWGEREITLTETAQDVGIRCDARGFCQASGDANRAIRAAVSAALDVTGPLRRVQEFYAGSGNLTALLIGRVPAVRSVEVDEEAVERARWALSGAGAAGTRIDLYCGDAAHLMEPPVADELWLLDPGRPGAREVCEQAARDRPAHIVYVSCALDTLGRDLRTLENAGYRSRSAVAIDAFPHTPHLEMVVHLALPAAQLDGTATAC